MKITNAYQAQLARLGGNTDVTVQPPVNKYEKLLGDIEAGGGSGGGGSSYSPFIITIDWSEDEIFYADKTFAEIAAFKSSGEPLYINPRDTYGDQSTPILATDFIYSEGDTSIKIQWWEKRPDIDPIYQDAFCFTKRQIEVFEDYVEESTVEYVPEIYRVTTRQGVLCHPISMTPIPYSELKFMFTNGVPIRVANPDPNTTNACYQPVGVWREGGNSDALYVVAFLGPQGLVRFSTTDTTEPVTLELT